MTHCTVTTSRNSRIIARISTVALLVCLGSLMIGVIPTISAAQAIAQVVLNALR